MSNIATLHNSLLNKIKVDVMSSLHKRHPEITSYTNEELLRTIFVNYRIVSGISSGLRLTNFGNTILSKHYQTYKYKIEDEISNFVFVSLDKSMLWPYYLGTRSNHVIFYSEEDAAWFRLNGNNIKNYVENI